MLDYSCINIDETVFQKGRYGKLYLSSCPGIGKDLDEDIRLIESLEIYRLVSLTQNNELNLNYLFNSLTKINIKYTKFAIINFSVPSLDQYDDLNTLLDEVFTDLCNNKNILIHCMAGLGRTGLLSALILTKFDISPNDAINIIRSARPGSIETEDQKNFVLNFKTY